MSEWYSSIYKALIFAGLIAFIVGFFTNDKTSLGAYMAGYSVYILAILMILTILLSNLLRVSANDSLFYQIYSIFTVTGPFILILAVISFVLYLLIKYKDNIIAGHVSTGYNSFSNIIVILLFIQFYLVYTNISSDRFQKTGNMPNVVSSSIYLFGVISAICSIILYTILKYYTTDGFVGDIN
jgi:hypothetical protein